MRNERHLVPGRPSSAVATVLLSSVPPFSRQTRGPFPPEVVRASFFDFRGLCFLVHSFDSVSTFPPRRGWPFFYRPTTPPWLSFPSASPPFHFPHFRGGCAIGLGGSFRGCSLSVVFPWPPLHRSPFLGASFFLPRVFIFLSSQRFLHLGLPFAFILFMSSPCWFRPAWLILFPPAPANPVFWAVLFFFRAPPPVLSGGFAERGDKFFFFPFKLINLLRAVCLVPGLGPFLLFFSPNGPDPAPPPPPQLFPFGAVTLFAVCCHVSVVPGPPCQ